MIKYRLGSYGVLDRDELGVSSIKIYDGGIEHRDNTDYRFDNMTREYYPGYLLQYTLTGRGIFIKDGITHILEKGMGFLSKMPEKSVYTCTDNESWEFVFLHFDGEALFPLYKKVIDLTNGVISLDPNGKAVDSLLRLQQRMISGGILEKYEGGRIAYELMCEILSEQERKTETGKSGMIRNAAYIMETEYSTITGVKELSERLGVSWEHFSRSFKGGYGVTPIKYLNDVRMQAAVNLLINTGDSVENIAVACGYGTGNYFSKVFRRYSDRTPSEYRKSIKGI